MKLPPATAKKASVQKTKVRGKNKGARERGKKKVSGGEDDFLSVVIETSNTKTKTTHSKTQPIGNSIPIACV